jgi:hypothetical protein
MHRIRILFFAHPGSRGQKGTGSRIRIRNTGLQLSRLKREPIVPYGKYNRVSAKVYLKEKCKKYLISSTSDNAIHGHINDQGTQYLYDETLQSEME